MDETQENGVVNIEFRDGMELLIENPQYYNLAFPFLIVCQENHTVVHYHVDTIDNFSYYIKGTK